MTHINFVSKASTYTASWRMRAQKPIELLNVHTDIKATTSNRVNLEADLCVFSKHFSPLDMYEDVKKCKEAGVLTIFDVCDNHWNGREHGPHYTKMCKEVDLITCNSKNMQEAIKENTGRDSFVCLDPIMFPQREPSLYTARGTYMPKLLWFGHASNFQGLVRWLPNIPTRVTVMSNKPLIHNKVDNIGWRPMLVETSIKDYDLVLIPSGGFPWSTCKSPNRAVDSLWSGKPFVSDDPNVYGELIPFGFQCDTLGFEFPKVLQELKNDPQKVRAKVEHGQGYLRKNLNDEIVLESWLNVLKRLDLIEREDLNFATTNGS